MLCVIARLSADATERLRLLRDTVLSPEQARTPLYGHITIATYLPEDDGAFIRACGDMLRDDHSFSVRYEKIEVLSRTSIIVATPAKTGELLSMHDRIAGYSGGSLDRWTCGNDWYPHTTLLHDPEADLDSLCRAMRRHFVPFDTLIRQIELSKVEKDGYTILETIRLR